MNCKETKSFLRSGGNSNRSDLVDHARRCRRCGRELALDRLTMALLNAHHSASESSGERNPFLMTGIKARIRELSEQGINSWESAILALRGWVIAFGAAAVLLLAVSAQWHSSTPGASNDQDADLSTLSALNEDYISGNLGKTPENLNSIDEAVGNAHK